MIEEEVSHIEIVEEEKEIQLLKVEKKFIFKSLTDMRGWKKDAKKIVISLCVLIFISIGYYLITQAATFSWSMRLHSPIEIISRLHHSQENPTFSFSFSKHYTYDSDEQKKYGDDYLAGFHLQSDQRIGCDVRQSIVGVNFSKSDQEISDAISSDLSTHVKGFSKYQAKRIKIDGKPAILSNFLLTDPLGNTLHINQIMVSNADKDYLIICGSGEAQYDFFQKDFQDFTDSFRWKK